MSISSLFSWTKSVSTSTIFIGIFALIFSVFLFSNTSVILSKFGFETTTTLKGKLAKAEEQLKAAKTENDTFKKELEALKRLNSENVKALSEANKEINKAKQTVSDAQKERTVKKKETVKVLEGKTVVTDTEITMPLKEYNELSAANIDSIQSTYDHLFQSDTPQPSVNESTSQPLDTPEPAMA